MPNIASFATYVLLMSFTPGPNNIMSMNNARELGLKRSFPFNLGILTGFIAVLIICEAFSGALYTLLPQVKPFMIVLGAGYMLFLAWRTLFPRSAKNKKKPLGHGFAAGALLQFINVKLYILGITAISTYVLPYFSSIRMLLFFAFIIAFTGFVSTLCWALFGAGLNRLFTRHTRVLNMIMAVLLCYCALSLFI